MYHWKAADVREQRTGLEFIKTQITLAALTAAAGLLIAQLISLVPRLPALPVLCLLALAGAGLVALFAWWRGAARDSDHVTAWDVAGALALTGFVAAMLSEPDSIHHLFE